MEGTYFTEINRRGEIELYEADGTFYNHDTQDKLVAVFYDKEAAEMVCKFLNKQSNL